MKPQSNVTWLIGEARSVLLLLEKGMQKEALSRIATTESDCAHRDKSAFSPDVQALWIQVGIAANNLSNVGYLDGVKTELNRVTFENSTKPEHQA